MGDDIAEIDQGFSSVANNHREVPWSVSRCGNEYDPGKDFDFVVVGFD
jgi:hypothetical protein